MIAKLVVWRGDHRKDASEKVRIGTGLGGFVPLDQLDPVEGAKPRNKSPPKGFAMRSPKHFLQKRSASKPALPDQELFDPPPGPTGAKSSSRHIPLFANIPGYEHATSYDRQAGYDIGRTPSNLERPPPSPSRPQTADATIGRRRSKTAPSRPSFEPPESLVDKPLPLAVDVDRKKSLKGEGEAPRTQSNDAGDQQTASSGTGKQSELAGKRNQSDTNLSWRRSGPAGSLTPSLSRSDDTRRSSQASKLTSPSSASHGSGSKTHLRSVSATSAQSTSTVKVRSPTKPKPGNDRSILDEVEGTLSATITELQELNAHWHGQGPPSQIHPAFRDQAKSSPPLSSTPQSTPDSFTPASGHHSRARAHAHARALALALPTAAAPTQRVSQSLPPTPFLPPSSSSPSSAPSTTATTPAPLQALQALQTAHDTQKRLTQLITDNENLRTHLSSALRRIRETDAVRLERDKFERELKEARKTVEELRVEAEAATNQLLAVEGRLEEVNVQKVDVLEENGELRGRVAELRREAKRLEGEVEELRVGAMKRGVEGEGRSWAVVVKQEGEKEEEEEEEEERKADLPSVVVDLRFRLEDAERVGNEKEGRIKELEQSHTLLKEELQKQQDVYTKMASLAEQAQRKVMSDCQLSAAKIAELTQKLNDKAKEAKAVQSERDKFEQLLLAEFRRTAIEIHARTHPAESLLSQKIDVDATVKQIRAKAESSLKDAKPDYEGAEYSDDVERRVKDFRKEIDYYLKDIILYKLDVKGYKKDLRKAQSKIQELEKWARENGFPYVDNKASKEPPSTPPQTILPQQSQGKMPSPSTPPQMRLSQQSQENAPRQLQPPVQLQYPVQQLQQRRDEDMRETEQRPSISSQSDDSTAPALSIGSTACEGSPDTPKAEVGIAVAFAVPQKGMESVQTHHPPASPVNSAVGGLGMF